MSVVEVVCVCVCVNNKRTYPEPVDLPSWSRYSSVYDTSDPTENKAQSQNKTRKMCSHTVS